MEWLYDPKKDRKGFQHDMFEAQGKTLPLPTYSPLTFTRVTGVSSVTAPHRPPVWSISMLGHAGFRLARAPEARHWHVDIEESGVCGAHCEMAFKYSSSGVQSCWLGKPPGGVT